MLCKHVLSTAISRISEYCSLYSMDTLFLYSKQPHTSTPSTLNYTHSSLVYYLPRLRR
ncbi:hypothetical protein WG66_007622, partial [Moniliophthora roreri]